MSSAYAHAAIEHWKKYRPALYHELKESGRLEEAAERAAELTRDELVELISGKGILYDAAWELVREKYIFLPSQEDQPNLGENPDYFPDPASPESEGHRT